jgi:hypothetical protein
LIPDLHQQLKELQSDDNEGDHAKVLRQQQAGQYQGTDNAKAALYELHAKKQASTFEHS